MKTNVYLNFNGNTEEAFNYYKQIFGGEYITGNTGGATMMRYGDMPKVEGMPELNDEQKNKIMHVALRVGSAIIMGTDVVDGMGLDKFVQGNHIYVSLHPESRAQADELFTKLSDGGKVEMAMQDMFWGDYYGSLTDKFGVGWMINLGSKK